MKNFRPVEVVNPNTQERRVVAIGNATLLNALPTTEREYTNASGETKKYKLVAIDCGFSQLLASVPAKTYNNENNKFVVGEKYMATLSRVEDKNNPGQFVLLANLSALKALEKDTAAEAQFLAEFDWSFSEATSAREVKIAEQ